MEAKSYRGERKEKKILHKWDWCRVWETCSYRRRCGCFLGVISSRKAQGCLLSTQDFRRSRLVLLSRLSIFPSFWSLPLHCRLLPIWSNSATLIFFSFHCHFSIPWLKNKTEITNGLAEWQWWCMSLTPTLTGERRISGSSRPAWSTRASFRMLWIWKRTRGAVWNWMGLCGTIWAHMELYGAIWDCMGLYGSVGKEEMEGEMIQL